MRWMPKMRTAREEHLGCIPEFLDDADERSATEQLAANYVSGWTNVKKFKMGPDGELYYPGDPAVWPLWESRLRDEMIMVYQHGWVAVVQSDGSYEVSRLD